MSEDEILHGGCTCGQVRYSVTGKPFAVNYCHCVSCRKHAGAVVVALAGYASSQVTFSGMERRIYASSPGVGRAFCSACGTPLTWEGDGGELGEILEIHIGTFDDPGALVPASHAFESQRIRWFDVADTLPRFEGFSEGSRLLHYGPAG
jgi:hypothetical protein